MKSTKHSRFAKNPRGVKRVIYARLAKKKKKKRKKETNSKEKDADETVKEDGCRGRKRRRKEVAEGEEEEEGARRGKLQEVEIQRLNFRRRKLSGG